MNKYPRHSAHSHKLNIHANRIFQTLYKINNNIYRTTQSISKQRLISTNSLEILLQNHSFKLLCFPKFIVQKKY